MALLKRHNHEGFVPPEMPAAQGCTLVTQRRQIAGSHPICQAMAYMSRVCFYVILDAAVIG